MERAVRPGGQPNLQQLMKQAQKMQQQMATAQA
ncbi:MAG TPA: YbaB/EbfC family nucleoid-associated protein, partial [Micromonosporaceae bacterium]|nr:YbaB/EbfC family nucleoid-associated protein [Micromonosporaceae bacterium]